MKTRSVDRTRTVRYGLLSLCFALSCMVSAYASTASISPTIPVEGQPVTVTYDPAGGPLAGVGAVNIYKGENGWNDIVEIPMTLSNGLWYVTYTVPTDTYQINFVFKNVSGSIFDNNSTRDWGYRTRITGAGVMMQGFYWDVPEGGTWYGTMTANAPGLRSMRGGYGIDRIWFPAPSKGESGGFSMGYDPYDYYDLGQYNQKGSIATRFGFQADLKNAISTYKDLGVLTMADIILNHRAGGSLESNPKTGGSTYTDFRFVLSGECTWRYNQFHPSDFEESDPGDLFFEDVCHLPVNVPGAAHYDLIEWGNWLRDPANAGFDGGWRFDYVKGVHDWYVEDFREGTGDDFGILEYFDGNISLIENYVAGSGTTAAFDFPAFFTMKDVFNWNQDIRWLIDPNRVYAARDPVNAVPFVANHDTDKEANYIDDKMLAYAFILTYQGYPCIFWKDYYNYGLNDLGGQSGNGIDPLVWVRGALGGGQPNIQMLKTDDNDFLIYGTQDGSFDAPGYIVAINNNDTVTQSASVTTANTFLHGKELECHAWYSYVSGQNVKPANTTCSAGGTVTVQAPPRGYAVYSIKTSLDETPLQNELNVGDAVDLPGSADYYSDTFTIAGSGSGVSGTADGCYFLYQETSGDCGIQARVTDLTDPGSMPKAGVMMRLNNANPGVKNAAVFVSPSDGVVFQWRAANFGTTVSTNVPGISLPCWVKLVRSGDTFSGFYSTDGSTWTQVGTSQTITLMGSPTITGPAVTAGDSSKTAIATMDQVSVNLTPALPEIGDEVLVAGNTLTITNVASDADTPAQILTYSLDNPPAGASIGSADGIFEWRPQIDQSPSTQTVTVVVSDDGVPDLSASRDFTVTVLQPASPSMSDLVLTNGQIGFSVGGDTGPDYSIMWTTNLLTGEWQPIYTTNSPALPFFWSTPVSGVETSEFFKVELGP